MRLIVHICRSASPLPCLVAAYLMAVAAYPIIRRRNEACIVTVAMACVAIVACLFTIPREWVVVRALAALLIIDLIFRLIDFARQRWRGDFDVSWKNYCQFLIPFPWLVAVFGQKKRRLRTDQRILADFLRLVLGFAGTALGVALLLAANKIAALQSSFVLDHITKLFIFALTVESILQALCGAERLMGFDTRPIYDSAVVSRTPADFWHRANTRSQAWLYLNVFVPSGGRHALARGVWATFLASAVLHEIAFSIAISRITGYQLMFFLMQAPAVLSSPRLDRLARSWGIWGAALAHAVTVVWIGATSVFFFDGIDRIFPFFYASHRWQP
jgi:hypothetical protein